MNIVLNQETCEEHLPRGGGARETYWRSARAANDHTTRIHWHTKYLLTPARSSLTLSSPMVE
jgi:hypothetical protein